MKGRTHIIFMSTDFDLLGLGRIWPVGSYKYVSSFIDLIINL